MGLGRKLINRIVRSDLVTRKLDVAQGNVYYTDKTVTVSGDGLTWAGAFKTIGEGVTALNAVPGTNATLYIAEGYYIELPMTLQTRDATIVGLHQWGDGVVLFGSSVAGTATTGSGAPALTIKSANCKIVGLGFANFDPLYSAVKVMDRATGEASISIQFIDCTFTKENDDCELYGIEFFGGAYMKVDNCRFTTSCKTAGIRLYSQSQQMLNCEITNCKFIGVPCGITVDASAHNTVVKGCIFISDSSDVPGTMATPIILTPAIAFHAYDCYTITSAADFITGAGEASAIERAIHASDATGV